MKKSRIAIFSLFFSANALAVQTGNELLDYLESQDSTRSIAGSFYVAGVIEGFVVASSDNATRSKFLCLPDNGLPVRQQAAIVKKYLTDNPEKRHEASRVLVVVAMSKAFPCSK